MATKNENRKAVRVGTFRPQNAEWIKSRRLYNLPLPNVLSHKEHKGHKEGRAGSPLPAALPFHRSISRIVIIAEVVKICERHHPNRERFPDRFMFQLTDKDIADLRSQIVTSNVQTSLRSQIVAVLQNRTRHVVPLDG